MKIDRKLYDKFMIMEGRLKACESYVNHSDYVNSDIIIDILGISRPECHEQQGEEDKQNDTV